MPGSVVLTNCKVVVGGSDISEYVTGITVPYEAMPVDDTTMGDGTQINKGGVKKWGGTISFNQDYGDGLVDEIVFALIGEQATFSGVPVNTTVSADNPNYNGTALFTKYPPINGQHGELAKGTLEFVSAGTLSRSVAP